MKKILYISVNSKSEEDSASKTVARKLINEVLSQCRYKVPKLKKHTYIYDEESENVSEASNYKCCNEIIDKKGDISQNDEANNKDTDKEKVLCESIDTNDKTCISCEKDEKVTDTMHGNVHKLISDTCCSEDLNNEEYCDDEKCCNETKEYECYDNNNDDTCKCECHDGEDDKWEECNEFMVEEVDLYKDYIPLLTHEFYDCRNTVVDGPGPCYESLTDEQHEDIKRIKELAYQFKEADVYIIAAPMWSLLFPAPLKQYLDCVILNGVTAEISKEKGCRGLLDDKSRKMVFVQSVGGELPVLLKCKLDHSASYLKDISKFLGISKFEELLVDGTGYTECEKHEAIKEAIKDIPFIARELMK